MGTVTETVPPIAGGTKKSVSDGGGVRFERLLGKHLMGATYATGGDTITMPAAPAGGTLFCVSILAYTRVAGMHIDWNLDTTTPKLIAYDEDNTSGIEAELSNGNAALAAVVVFLEFIYKIGA